MSVPVLRFKEFSAKWKVKPLGDLFSIVVGFVGTVSNFYCDEIVGVPFIRTLNVKDGWFSHDDIQFVTNEFHKKNKKSQIYNNDILIARVGANMGMVCKVQGLKAEANSANVVIIKSNSTHDSGFYTLYLSSPKGQKQIQEKGAGGAQEVLNISVAKTIIVPVPASEEQTKIANFLTAVDEKITQLTQKCDLLIQYKKGVMQQIFSQKLRFKDDDGRDFPEWEGATLGELIYEKSTKYNPESQPENLKCIELEHLSQETGVLLGYVDAANQKSIKNRFNKGDVLFGKLRPYLKKFLKAPFDGVCSTEIWVLKGKKLANDYLYQLVQTENFLALTNISSGSKMPRADWGIVASAVIQYPALPEQTKIANFLTALDDKINNAQAQLAAVKQYKQGLLQQMFV